MLSAEAYSFRLKSRLAISLSWVAGFTNVIVLIACGQTISHQTGNTTHLGRSLGDAILLEPNAISQMLFFGFIVGAFLSGAIASAFFTGGARRSGRPSKYILPMSLESGLLLLLLILLKFFHHLTEPHWGSLCAITGVAAFAMGLQNATITRISGAVVRTTHLTGVITDFGLEIVELFYWWSDRLHHIGASRYGRMLKVSRKHPSALRLALLASIFGSFLFGAIIGSILYSRFGSLALLAPVLFLIGIVLIDYMTPIADVREIDPTRDGELLQAYGDLKSLLPPEVGIFRLTHHNVGRYHHAPDFGNWADRIPRHWRIVILSVSPLTQFDQDTAASLLKAVQTLKSHGRNLVISGMNRIQFKTLMDCGVTRLIDLDNFVPDLEFAIARGINLAREKTSQVK